MTNQPAEEPKMDSNEIRARLIAACDTDKDAAPADDLRSRLARASRPSVRLRMSNPRPTGSL